MTAFGPHDERWLLLAELLARWANAAEQAAENVAAADVAVLDAALRGLLADGGASGTTSDGVRDCDARDTDALIAAVRREADAMEEAGVIHLAYATLTLLERGLARDVDDQRGLIVAQRARAARKAGAVDAAADLYAKAARIGRAAGDRALVARSLLGRAVLARRRGDYPSSRALYRSALSEARRAGAPELEGLAHHGLLIAASVGGDFDAALVHGWAAFELMRGYPDREADILGELAAVSSDAGHYAAALHAYLGAAARSISPRVRLPALSGAALCAARLDDDAGLRRLTDVVDAELGRAALPYERAQALLLLAEAWGAAAERSARDPVLGPEGVSTSAHVRTRATGYRARALEAARTHEFHELVFRAEALADVGVDADVGRGSARDSARNTTATRARSGATRPRGTVGVAGRRVLAALAALDVRDVEVPAGAD
jgi:tetratricopeptide (TPR) repeat protein